MRELSQTRLHQKENTQVSRKRVITEILLSVWGDEAERTFFYRLDYDDWVFRRDSFRKTPEERYLDQMLYKIALIGNLLRSGSVTGDDVRQAEFFVFTVVGNDSVIKYFEFVRDDVPLGVSFSDAYGVFLYFCNLRICRGKALEMDEKVEESVSKVQDKKALVLSLMRDKPPYWWDNVKL